MPIQTNKSLQQLSAQELQLERAMRKYPNSGKVAKAEHITEEQIRAKGGTPHPNARVGAVKRRLAKKNGNSKS